jgi:autotransporter-associated beta strand protein
LSAERLAFEPLEDRLLLSIRTWDGGGSDALWSNPANWVGDVAPMADDNLVFPDLGPAAQNLTNDFAPGTSFYTIQIQGSAYNLGGNPIALVGGLTASNATGSNTFVMDVKLLNAQSFFSANAGATLNLTGQIDTANLVGTSNSFGTSALTLDGDGAMNLSGKITGAGSVSKFGTGTATLSGANDYQGMTDVRQGMLVAASDAALGSATTGDTQIQAGAALGLEGNVTIAEPLAVREGGIGFGTATGTEGLGALRSLSGTNTWTGNIDLAGGNNLIGVDGGSTLIVSGVISNAISAANRMIKVGDGTLRFTGSQPNVYRGETRVLQGTLELGKDPGVHAFWGNLIIGDDLEANGTKTVRLLNDNQIPHLDYFNAGLTTVYLRSTGVLDFNGKTDTVGNVQLYTGQTDSADIDLNGGTMVLGGASIIEYTFQGSSGATPAATIQDGTLDLGTFFSGAGGGVAKTIQADDTQLTNVATDLDIAANIVSAVDVSLTRTGGGTLRLGGTNSGLHGPVILTAGITEIASDTAFGDGLLSLQNNILKPVGSRTIANPIGLDGTITCIGQDSLIFSGPATLSGSRDFLVMDPEQTVTFSGGVGEGIFGSLYFHKRGPGTMVLSGTNTYSGYTYVGYDGGTLELSGNGTILNSNTLEIRQAARLKIVNAPGSNLERVHDLAQVNLYGGTLEFQAAAGLTSTETLGILNLGANLSQTVVSDSNGGTANLTFQQIATPAAGASLNFVAQGTDLGTANNKVQLIYNPPSMANGIVPQATVTSTSGRLDFATIRGSSLGFEVVALDSAAYKTDLNTATSADNVRLASGVYNLANSRTINSLVLEDGAVLNLGGHTLSIQGTNGLAGLILSNGSVIGNDAGADKGTLNLSLQAFITVPEGATAAIHSVVMGANTSITKAGRGKLILSGDNQFTGLVNVNEGILNVRHSNALGLQGNNAGANGTTVRQRATLEVENPTGLPADDVKVLLEALSLTGVGFGAMLPNGNHARFEDTLGALCNVAGNNSWAGNVSLGGDATNLTASSLHDGFPIISSSMAVFTVQAASSLAITGAIVNNIDVVKRGGGQLEYAGVLANTYDAATWILEGTLLLNKEPGINAVINRVDVGTNAAGAPPATLRLGASDQMRDDRGVRIHASGLFDVNGQAEVLGGNFELVVGRTNAADLSIGAGGLLTPNVNTTVYTIGTGNPAGATISGGTFGLQVFGVIAAAGARTIQVNDGATGDDLTVTSAIVDGTGLQSVGIAKGGFGTLVLGGATANTMTGDTTVNEGTLVLDKGSGSGGVNALSGRLYVGDNAVTSGYAGADVVLWRQSNQLPDQLAYVELRANGRLDLNGQDETIGNAVAQNALYLSAASSVATGGGTLTINGNLQTSGGTGAGMWTTVAPPVISGNLNLGSVLRTITVADRSELPYDAIISANISGSGGLCKTVPDNSPGSLLLSGDNSGLTGDLFIAPSPNTSQGPLAAGSNTALGSGRVYLASSGAGLLAYGGARTLSNPLFLAGTSLFLGGGLYGTSGGTHIASGGNNLKFTGPANLTGGTTTLYTLVPMTVEFAGGLGELYGSSSLAKSGFGTLVLSGDSPYSGTTTINTNGGTILLTENGAARNSAFTVNVGGVLQVGKQDSSINLTDRISDTAALTLAGGALALVGRPGEASSELLGPITLANGTTNTLQSIVSPSAGSSARWNVAGVTRTVNQGSTLTFQGLGVDLGATTANQIAFSYLGTAVGNSLALDDGIIPFAVIANSTGLEFATWTNTNPILAPLDNFLTPLNSFGTSLAGATAATNVKLSADEVLAGAATVNAVLIVGSNVDLTGTGSLAVSSGLLAVSSENNSISASTLTLGGSEGLIYTSAGADLNISSVVAGASSVLGKGGRGAVTISGANTSTFTGTAWVTDGLFRAQKNTAFGTTGGNVEVQYGATVELSGGITIPAEAITLRGSGEGNLGAIPLRSVSGGNTWQGNVNLGYNRTGIDVATGSELVVNGVVSNQSLNKFGGGTLELGGTANNTFIYTSIIWQGTVELNKTGANAIPSLTDNNEFFIGNYYGNDNSATLRLLQDNQIADGPFRLRIMPTGVLDLNGHAETLLGRTGAGNNHDALGLDIGSVASPDVDLNGGTLRIGNTVADNGRIQIRVLNGGLATAATISDGTLELQGTTAVTRRLLVDDSTAMEDLIITATIADGSAVGTLQKDNGGRLVLAPSAVGGNTYTAPTLINGGEVVIRNANALGTAAGATTVNSGYSLLIDGASSAENLTLNGIGFGSRGAVVNLAGNNTWSGNVTLAGTTAIGVEDSTKLILSGAIGQSAAAGVNKLLNGTLQYAGNTSNSYAGTTQVQDGILELNKTGAVAIVGRIEAGNDSGTAGAAGVDVDVVRWLQSDQTGASEQLLANSEGLLDLNGCTETVTNNITSAVFTRLGPTSSGRFHLNGGTLIMQGGTAQSIGASVTGTTMTASPSGVIEDGRVALNGNTSIDVADSLAYNDLTISAILDNDPDNNGTANGTLTKVSAGTLNVTVDNSGSNVLIGTVALSAGILAFGHDNALGNATLSVTGASGIRAEGGERTVGNNITLAANLTLRGDQAITLGGTILNSGGDRALISQLNHDATAMVTGQIRLTENTTNARTFLLQNDIFDTVVDVQGQIVNGGTGAPNSAIDKRGVGTVQLSNTNNTFGHDVRVNAGILRIAGWGALNAAATNAIYVNSGALEVPASAGTTGTRPFNITSAGFNAPSGGLRIIDDNSGSAQTVTVNTNVAMAGNAYIGVEGAADTLVLGGNGALTGANTLTKVGAGTLELAGGAWAEAGDTGIALSGWIFNGVTSSNTNVGTLYYKLTVSAGTATVDIYRNTGGTQLVASGSGPVGTTIALTERTYSGLSGSVAVAAAAASDTDVSANTLFGANVFGLAVAPGTVVAQGTLRLNKNAGFNATGAGWIKVGDEGGGDGADRLVWAASDQLHDALLITVGSSGQLDLNGFSDTIGSLVLNRNATQSADVAIGSGTLTLAGNTSLPATLEVANVGLTTGTTPAATISGSGTLQLTESAPTIVVADSLAPASADDLTVSVVIGGTYSGTSTTFAPGLRESRSGNNAFDEVTFGTRTTSKPYPEAAETTEKGPWVDNDSWIYSGQIYDADGIFALAGGIDDNFEIFIDGQRVLRHGGSNIGQTGSPLNRDGTAAANPYGGIINYGMGPRGDGWHDVEFRITQGGGGAGPYVAGWGWLNSTYGFGYTSRPGTALNASWWGQNYFIPFGSTTPIDGALRYAAGSTTAGQIGSIVTSGTGTLNLTLTPATDAPFDVQGGMLKLSGADGTLLNAPSISITGGGTLMLDNQAAVAAGGRLSDSAGITLAGGNLALVGNATTPVTENVGPITLSLPSAGSGNANAIGAATVGAAVVLQADSLLRNAGATVSFIGAGAHLDAAANVIKFDAAPAGVVGGILPYATVGRDSNYDAIPETIDLVADVDPGASYTIGRLTTYDASNVKVTANTSLSGTINALLIDGNGATINTGAGLTVASGQVVNTGGSNTISSGNLAFGAAEPLLFVEPAAILTIGSSLTGSGDLRKERAGDLLLTGDNSSFSGAITVAQGSLAVGHANALGTTSASTTVNDGARLFIDGVAIPAEPLTLYGSGINGLGVLSSAGSSSIAGTVNLAGGAAVINVAASSLDLSGAILGKGESLTKTGRGTLVFTGTTSNGYTGPTTVAEGTLQLNKSGSAVAIPGNLFIGDMAGSDLLQYGPAAGGNQIDALRVANGEAGDSGTNFMRSWIFTGANKLNTDAANNRVYWKLDVDAPIAGSTTVSIYKDSAGTQLVAQGTVTTPAASGYATIVLSEMNDSGLSGSVVLYNGSGLADDTGVSGNYVSFDTSVGVFVNTGGTFDLATNNKSETIGPLLMTGGTVDTGTGVLTLGSSLVYSAGGAATINGNLNLGNASRNFHVYDGASTNDLTINAVVSNGRITKTDAGLLRLNNPANSFLAGVNEVQRVAIAGATAGVSQFTITFNGLTTGTITVGANDAATQANIQAALDGLANIGPGNSTVSVAGAGLFNITFTGSLAAADLPNQITTAVVTAPGTFTPSTITGGAAGIVVAAGTLAVGSDTALGSARLHLTASSQLLPAGDRVLTNGVTINPGITITFGGRRDVDGTDDLTLTSGVTLIGPTGANVVNLDVIDPQTLVTMSGVISGGGDFLVPTKRGIGTLVWSGDNTFDVRDFVAAATLTGSDGLRVEGGILRVAHSNALGFSGELATVNVRGDLGAVLELDGSAGAVEIAGRVLELVSPDSGTARGFLNRTSTEAVHTGILRNLAGDNSITSNQIRLRNVADNANAGTMYLGADAGSLNLIGAIIGLENDATPTVANNRTLYKVGGGTLTLSGTTANTYTGNTAVMAGTLQLNKSGTVAAVAGGTVYVGDNAGSANSDRLVYGAAGGTDQIAGAAINVTVGTSGQIDFGNTLEDVINTLTLTVGDSFSSSATSDVSGEIKAGVYAVNVRPGINSAVAAAISGNLDVGAADKTFTVNDGPGDVELNIPATVVATGTAGVIKAGAGRLALSGDNTYNGGTTVSAGALRIEHADALGDTGAATTTTVASGASLELNLPDGSNTIDNENLNIVGSGILNGPVATYYTGVLGTGALRNLSGDNTVSGTVTLNGGDAAIEIAADVTLILSGQVTQSGTRSLIKDGPGTLELGGAVDNTYAGNTLVNEGTLFLNKSANKKAIDGGTLFIGDGLGGNDADVVKYGAGSNNQIDAGAAVSVVASGRLDLATNNASDTIDGLILGIGPTASGDVALGDGTLTMNGNITAIGTTGITAASPAATILGGTLSLNNATRYAYVRETAAAVELNIGSAMVAGGTKGMLAKHNSGALELSANNTGAPLHFVEGTLIASADGALGTTDSTLVIPAGATLAFRGDVNYTSPKRISNAGGTGYQGQGSIVNLSGDNSFAGPIHLGLDTLINSASPGDTLTLSGSIDANFALTVDGPGNTVLSGTISGTAGMVTGWREDRMTNYQAWTGTSTTPVFYSVPRWANAYDGFPLATTCAYTAQLFDEDGLFSVAYGPFDDSAQISLNSAVKAAAGGGPATTGIPSPAYNGGSPGWINVDARFSNNGGPGGSYGNASNWHEDFGFGLNMAGTTSTDATNYVQADVLLYPGRFRTAWAGAVNSVTKNGAGTLTLSGANTYDGPTTVNAGMLLVNNTTGSGTGTGNVTVEDDAILAGFGIVGGPVTVDEGGELNPGSNLGTLTVNAATSFSAGATFRVELTAAVSDQLASSGPIDLGSSTLEVSRDFSPALHATFTIVNNTSSEAVIGEFDGLADGSLVDVDGIGFRIDYHGGDGNDVVLERLGFALNSLVVDAGQATSGDDTLRATGTDAAIQLGLQHSTITRIVVTLDGVMTTWDAGAFTLEQLGLGGGQVGLTVTPSYVGGSTLMTLTFQAGTGVYQRAVAHDFALIDGDFKLTIDATKFHDIEGDLAAGRVDNFFRFFGDSDGDRDVDGMDMNRLRRVMANDPLYADYVAAFDHNGDGLANTYDYTQFRGHYGKKLRPAPGALQQGAITRLVRAPVRRV